MSFAIDRVELKGIMELTGAIDFPQNKVVVVYGSNQQGKTNVINAIRYAFLRDVKGLAKPKKEYDERLLPTRDELIFGDRASITINFHHASTPYTMVRSLASKGKREESSLSRTDRPDQPEEIERFLRTRLKVSLLDVLFAPDIAQGFKQLHSGNLDDSVAQMFKEITTLREMAEGFVQRFNRLKSAADAQCSLIEGDYTNFRSQISKLSSSVASLPEFKELEKFEPGKTFQKLEKLHSNVKGIVAKLREEGFASEIGEAFDKARELAGIRNKLKEEQSVERDIGRLNDVRSDHRTLKTWASLVNSVTKIEDPVKPVPSLRDATIQSKADGILSTLGKAKKAEAEAGRLAKEEGMRIDDVPVALKELKRLADLLSKKARIGSEIGASVTKVGSKVYAVLPFKLLAKDASFTDINRQPITKGDPAEKEKYLDSLRGKIKRLGRTKALADDSIKLFDSFAQDGKRSLHTLVDGLDSRADKIDDHLERWSKNLSSASSSFVGKKIAARKIKSANALAKYTNLIDSQVTKAESRHLTKIKRVLRQVNVQIAKFDTRALAQASHQVSEQKKELPQTEEAERLLAERKVAWEKLDEKYNDYSQVPRIADASISILEAILSKCFDEAKLRESIAGTYKEIITLMHERRLIQAIAEVPAGSLKTVVKYKDKIISHPAGSEKAFYSLAILTALAHYFQTPVLIDEVANNLDSKNLRAFFELVRDFKDRYSVQYVLSIKQTNDFDFDGWVKDLREDVVVHEIKEKNITEISLSQSE